MPWIVDQGFEFFPLGGDPRVLSEFVCKHRCGHGCIPTLTLCLVQAASCCSANECAARTTMLDKHYTYWWNHSTDKLKKRPPLFPSPPEDVRRKVAHTV